MGKWSVGSSYFDRAISHTNGDLMKAARENITSRYDTLVGTGMSGVIAVARLAPSLRKNALYVRKPDDKSTHSSSMVEGHFGESFIIVDDIICTGNTVCNILEHMIRDAGSLTFRGYNKPHAKMLFKGVYSYQEDEFIPAHIVGTEYMSNKHSRRYKDVIERMDKWNV